MVVAANKVLPLPERSLNYWHEGVWVSVRARAPVWCLRGRGWEKGTKPPGIIIFSLVFTAPILRVGKSSAWPAYSTFNSAIFGLWGAVDV